MAFEDAGVNQAIRNIWGSINRRWAINIVQLSLRYLGFLLLGLILYLHFLFHQINSQELPVLIWMGSYFVFQVLLEIFHRARISFYGSEWFIAIRIFVHIAMVSGLLYVATLARGVLIFAYLIPFTAAVVYFPNKRWILFSVYALSLAGFILGSVFFDSQMTFDFWKVIEVIVTAIVLGIMILSVQIVYRAALDIPEGISDAIRRVQSTLSITEIANQIAEGAQMICDADGVFVLIIDPDHHNYIWHKLVTLQLDPQVPMSQLIQDCNVLRVGEGFEKDDIYRTKHEEYFKKFFSPPPRSILIEPIGGRGKSILGLILVSSSRPSMFDTLKKRFFRQFCSSVGTAVESSLLYRKARLGLASSEPTSDLEADRESAIAKILVKRAADVISKADGCVLHRFEIDDGYLVPAAGVKTSASGQLVPWEASHIDPQQLGQSIMRNGVGIAGHAIQLRKVISAPDVKNHPWFEKSAQVSEFTSLLSVPLIDPDTSMPMGVLSVHSKQQDAFTLEDEVALVSLAKQGSTSLYHAREFESWRPKGGMLKRIFESVWDIDFEAGDANVCQQLAQIAVDVLPLGIVRIRLYDETTGDLVTVAAVGYPEQDQMRLIKNRLPYPDLKRFLKDDYRVERSYLIPSDAPDWEEFADKYLYVTENAKSSGWDKYDAFFTPLTSERQLLGYIAWDKPENGNRPSRQIIEAVGAFASMAAWSIDLARAYGRIREQSGLINSFLSSTIEQLAATRDLRTIGEVAVNIGRDLLHAEACSIYLVDGNELVLTHSTYLKNTHYINRRKPIQAVPGGGLSSWVAATRETLRFNSETEYQKHTAWAGETEQLQYLESKVCKSLLFVPCVGRSRKLVGVLSFENRQMAGGITGFSDTDLNIATQLGEEIGLAFGLAEQLKNVKSLAQLTLEDDLHELKNHFQNGVRVRAENALFWLEQNNANNLGEELTTIDRNSTTILNELYSLHNAVQKKYYEIENFRTALDLLVNNLLRMRDLRIRGRENANILIDCVEDIKLPPLLRYVFIRIASGALMNAIDHSGFLQDTSVSIKVSVNQNDGYVYLIIRDTGRGVKEIKPGYGIGRMRELVGNLKNRGVDIKLWIDLAQGEGTEVKLRASPHSMEM